MNILITGGSRGIGYETAKQLAAEHKVISVARSAEKNCPAGVIPLPFDLGKGNIKKELLPQIQRHFSSVNVLINNAAAFVRKPFEQIAVEEMELIFRVNVFSVMELIQAVLPLIQSGHVLNISSVGGMQGSVKFPGLSVYSATKAALIALTECLAEEYKNRNFVFNCIAFGAVQTQMLEAAFPGFKAPLTARQAAEFVAYFALNGQKYFNGKIIEMSLSTP